MYLKSSIAESIQKRHLLLFLCTAVPSMIILLHSFTFDIFQYGDNCGYMSLAVALVSGQGFTDPAIMGSPHFLWWPPGFPLFIAAFVAVFGQNWALLKIIIFFLLYAGIFLFGLLIQSKYKNLLQSCMIVLACSVNAALHLLSSYLYAETFFVAMTLIFFYVWNRWYQQMSVLKVCLLSLLAVYIGSIRLIGIALCIVVVISVFIYHKKCKYPFWYSVIPALLLVFFILISLYVPPLRVDSFRAILGMHPQFNNIITGTAPTETVAVEDFLSRYKDKTAYFFRGYGLSLVPQALIRNTYDLFTMNKAKAAAMLLVTSLVVVGWIRTSKRFFVINCYVFLFSAVIYLYGPKYLRLIIPIVPFLCLYLYSGVEKVNEIFTKKSGRTYIVYIFWTLILVDNAFLTLSQPHRTMPPQFGDDGYQKCLNWIKENTRSGDIVVSQVHSYLFLLRGKYCLPFNYPRTANEFITYLEENKVDYIVISPFYQRSSYVYMEKVREAVAVYPELFNEVFRSSNGRCSILTFDKKSSTQ